MTRRALALLALCFAPLVVNAAKSNPDASALQLKACVPFPLWARDLRGGGGRVAGHSESHRSNSFPIDNQRR